MREVPVDLGEEMVIRPADERDIQAIAGIYAHYVRTATLDDQS